MEKKTFRNPLTKFQNIALDTSCFIYQFEDYGKLSLAAADLFIHLQNKNIICSTVVLSELLASEVIVSDKSKLELLKSSFFAINNLKPIPPTIEIAEMTAFTKVKYHLGLPDAIHLTTAISHADVFITNDKTLKRVKEIPVLILEDFT